MATRGDVEAFRVEHRELKSTFTCRTCGDTLCVDGFYTKRDFGKVYLVTKTCKVCQKFYQIHKEFGLTREGYCTLLAKQEGCCAICGVSADDYAKQGYRDYLSVDHCHDTGHIRGLLCDKCNRGIGLFKEDADTMRSAISYISKDNDIV